MGADQIVGVYGNWFIRGSNLDYNNPSAGSIFPDADPTPDEIAFLQQTTNLSPNCYNDKTGCLEIDLATLIELNPEYIVYIDNGLLAQEAVKQENPTEIEAIFIDTLYDYDANKPCRSDDYQENKANCVTRSSIDIIKRIEELAIALGVDPPATVQQDKTSMCQAAVNFANTMQRAHNSGLRVMAAVADISADATAIRPQDPTAFWTLRTFEELGMPIMHGDNEPITTSQWFVACTAANQNASATCNKQTKLPADFFIFDSRSYPLVDTDEFQAIFPDAAILADQYWHFARNDGAISYRSMTKVLNKVSAMIGQATRLHDTTPCVTLDPTSPDHLNAAYGGLENGQYVCYNRDFLQDNYVACSETKNAFSAQASGGTIRGTLLITMLLASQSMYLS
jgi:hypothetical protein